MRTPFEQSFKDPEYSYPYIESTMVPASVFDTTLSFELTISDDVGGSNTLTGTIQVYDAEYYYEYFFEDEEEEEEEEETTDDTTTEEDTMSVQEKNTIIKVKKIQCHFIKIFKDE